MNKNISRSMTRLDLHHKRFIVKMLALGESPADVAEMMDDKFLVSPDEEEVRRFMPERGEDSALSDDLRAYYNYVRGRHFVEKEPVEESVEEFVQVAQIADLEGNSHLCVEVDGQKIALFKWGNAVYALNNTCSHAGGPLSDGFVSDGEVECPLHGARFDLETGEASEAPATEGVSAYPVRFGEKHIEVQV